MNSAIVRLLVNFLMSLYEKIKESALYSIVKKIDRFIRTLIKKSLIFSFFSSEDNFDESYKLRISDHILSFKNKIINKTKFINKWVTDSLVNRFMVNLINDFFDISINYYGTFLAVVGIFSVLRYILIDYNILLFIVSVIMFVAGVVMICQRTSLRKLLTDSVILRKILKGLSVEIKPVNAVNYNNTTACVLGIIIGVLTLAFGIIPALLPVAAIIFVYFVIQQSFIAAALVAFLLPFLPTMALVALSLLVLCTLLLKKVCIYPDDISETKTVMNFAVPVYMISLIFGTVFSYTPAASFKIALVYLAFALFYYAIVKSIKTVNQFVGAIYAVVIASIPVSVYGVIQRIVGFEEQSTWHDEKMFEDISGRVVSFFENPNVFGEYLIWLVIISLSAFIVSKNKKLKTVFAVAFIASVASMVFTYSRGCWIGVIIAVAIYLFLTNRKVFWAFAFCGLISIFFLPDSIISRISSVGDMADTSTSYRVYIWKGTFEMLKDYWLTGIGLGSSAFNEIYPVYAYSAISAPHPHNLYLLIVSETGIMGVIGFLFVIFVYYKNMIKSFIYTRNSDLKNFSAAFIAAMTGYLIQGLFDNVWYNYRIYMLFWIFVAFATSLYLKSMEAVTNDENS